MEWAREAYLSDYKFDSPHTFYNATLTHLKKLQFKICHPMKSTVKLEEDNMEAGVVAFDVKDMLASLFIVLN